MSYGTVHCILKDTECKTVFTKLAVKLFSLLVVTQCESASHVSLCLLPIKNINDRWQKLPLVQWRIFFYCAVHIVVLLSVWQYVWFLMFQRTIMSSDLLVDLQDDLGGDDSPSAALDQLKLVQSKQWPPDDPVSLSKSGECPRSCKFQFVLFCKITYQKKIWVLVSGHKRKQLPRTHFITNTHHRLYLEPSGFQLR